MNELKISYDWDGQEEVGPEITFNAVPSGETSSKSVFFSNQIHYPLNIEIILTGDKDILIGKSIKSLNPRETKEVIFNITPKTTRMKPVKAKFNVKVNYVVM